MSGWLVATVSPLAADVTVATARPETHPAITALLILGLLMLLLWFVWTTASRLDRQHRKVAASRMALDAQLVRRAGVAVDLSRSGLLDPASALLVADSAYAALDAEPQIHSAEHAMAMAGFGRERETEESSLSATLREVLDAPASGPEADGCTVGQEIATDRGGAELLASLHAAWYRAQIARRFHNEAVAQARYARRFWYVRALHLAGHAPMPQSVEFDDALPSSLPD